MKKRGRLIYVVGSSGAGKDTLLRTLQERNRSQQFIVAKRYITRPHDLGNEQHIELSKEEFLSRQQQGFFALSWHAHRTHYGVNSEIEVHLAKGIDVFINGSRAYITEVIEQFPDMLLVWITVNDDVLKQRLIIRGRESLSEIESRVFRNRKLEKNRPAQCVKLDNSGTIEDTLTQLNKLLVNYDV